MPQDGARDSQSGRQSELEPNGGALARLRQPVRDAGQSHANGCGPPRDRRVPARCL